MTLGRYKTEFDQILDDACGKGSPAALYLKDEFLIKSLVKCLEEDQETLDSYSINISQDGTELLLSSDVVIAHVVCQNKNFFIFDEETLVEKNTAGFPHQLGHAQIIEQDINSAIKHLGQITALFFIKQIQKQMDHSE